MGNLNKVVYTDHQTVITASNLNDIQDAVVQNTSYTTCTTAANTAAKTAALTNFVLTTGSAVKVKFTNTNTAANPTLNVNSTGAKPIMLYGVTPAGITPPESWNDGAVVEFVYDGTNWIISDAVSKNAIEIPVNADLNDYTTVGEYFCASAANVQTLSNCPVAASFNMRVSRRSANYIVQQIETGAALCTRTSTSSGWNEWHNFVRSDSGVFTQDVTINDEGTTTSSEVSMLTLGNSTATGTVGNSNGMIRMYGQGDKYVQIRPITTSGSYTSANRTITFPDESGTLMTNQGGTFDGRVTIDFKNGTTSSYEYSFLELGNNKNGMVSGKSIGLLRLWGTQPYYIHCYPASTLTGNRYITFPNADGELTVNQTGTWSPQLYDYETYKTTLTNMGEYIRIGSLAVFSFNARVDASITFSTMLQVRGFPFSVRIFGGNMYCAGATNSLGDKTIQYTGNAVYLRPNYTGTVAAPAWWSGCFIGIIA